ncbi:MAG: hypothetical protein V3U92_05770 [Cellulophaga sp.]
MEKRELLSYILGYLYEVNSLKKIPSEKIKIIKEFIEQLKKEVNEKNDNNSEPENFNTDEYLDLMDGYDSDKDSDQQNPNFW